MTKMKTQQIKMPAWGYNTWIGEQSKTIEIEMRRRAMSGNIYNCAVYVIPAKGLQEGKLILADEMPEDATDVLRFKPNGSTSLSAIPYSALPQRLWEACRNVPICPA